MRFPVGQKPSLLSIFQIGLIFCGLGGSGAVAAEAGKTSFTNDVLPFLTKAGCAGGNCHAKPEGQNNFKLSIFAYDPVNDYREIVMDDRGRRVFPAAPEQSLLLLKATGSVPHEGGTRFEKGSEAWNTILRWMEEGMPMSDPSEPKLEKVEVSPGEQISALNAAHQLKVTARYSDGSVRDVTRLADYLSNEHELAEVDEAGVVKIGSVTGEAVIVARYMGMVDVARFTVPPAKTLPDSLYSALPVNNEVDRLVYVRLKKLGLLPSDGCTDEEFLRRATLDVLGRLPSREEVVAFAGDRSKDRRDKAVERLLQDGGYADYWAVKWGDLIRPNPSRVGVKPVYLLDDWLRESFRQNKPWNAMVRELLTAQGSTHQYGPVAMFRDKREPEDMGAFVSQIFLGVRMDCARCHHHPNEKWSMEDYFQLAAFFGQMKRKGQGISAPISGEPEYWWYAPGGSGVTHPVTDAVMVPRPPDGPEMPYVDGQDPRAELADWMASSENPFFARAIVNRIWGEFFGRGIVEPVDDFRASNPASNEALLDWLAQDFVQHGYDLKHLMGVLMCSHTYQLSSMPTVHNIADSKNFSRSMRKRLSAEVLLDAVCDVTGVRDNFSGTAPGARAMQTWNHKLDSDFLDAFGRPNASQECPCERDRKPSVVQALHLMNSSRLQEKLTGSEGRVKTWAESEDPIPNVVREIYLAAYGRLPQEAEAQTALRYFAQPGISRRQGVEDVLWALLNSAEFVFNH